MEQRAQAQDRKVRFLNRMIFSYTVVFSGILLIIFTMIFFVLRRNSEEEARLNSQMLVNQPLKQMDRFLSEMDNMAYNVMINEELIRRFSMLREEELEDNHYDRDILDNIDTGSILTTINGRFSPVWRISAYNDRDFIYTGALVDRQKVKEVLRERDISGVMEGFRTGEPAWLLSPPAQDGWSDYFKSRYITLTRPIMNAYSRDVVGLVDVQQNLTVLEDYLRLSEDRPLFLNLYAADGAPVLLQGGEGDVVIATAVSDEYGWTVELLEPLTWRREEGYRLLQLMALSWLALSVILYMVTRMIATRIARPLTNLTDAVRGMNIAAPTRIEISDVGIDEVAALQTAFNNMLERLTFSLDQEKKSFLLAMQAQMNPHFLYNVLSVINAVALENRSDTVVAICGNLSSMLRYSSSYATGYATVREELDHTVAYLELMKSRYDYMFHYTVEVDPSLEEEVIPKLVIQPLCENCFMHAFSDMEPPYQVDIAVAREPGGWMVRVTDNGPGFPEEARRNALERANHSGYDDLSKMQLGGLGLVSSVLRLKIMLQTEILCDITAARPQGASVVIHIPRKAEDTSGPTGK